MYFLFIALNHPNLQFIEMILRLDYLLFSSFYIWNLFSSIGVESASFTFFSHVLCVGIVFAIRCRWIFVDVINCSQFLTLNFKIRSKTCSVYSLFCLFGSIAFRTVKLIYKIGTKDDDNWTVYQFLFLLYEFQIENNSIKNLLVSEKICVWMWLKCHSIHKSIDGNHEDATFWFHSLCIFRYLLFVLRSLFLNGSRLWYFIDRLEVFASDKKKKVFINGFLPFSANLHDIVLFFLYSFKNFFFSSL